MKTVKVKPSSPDQGEFVVINASDFNPNIHELCEGEKLDGAFKANLIPGEPADLSGLVPTEQFDAVAQKLTETEDQLNKEREAAKKLTAENTELQNKVLIAEKTLVSADEEIKALKDRITYLQEPLASGGASAGTPAEAKPKKPTAAELKAAKAAEDAAQANETKE